MTHDHESLADRIEDLFGIRELPLRAGVLHVTALSRRPEGFRTIAIDDSSPPSERDLFALHLGRARADAIIITGKLLRDEPNYGLQSSREHVDAFASWRKSRRGDDAAPTLVVMTRSGELDPQHPIFHSSSPVIVYTSPTGAERAREQCGDIECIIDETPSLASLLATMKSRGTGTIVLEAGPTATRAAYEKDLVDELMLSVFEGPFDRPFNEVGSPFDQATLERCLPHKSEARSHDEASGRWSFVRRWR